jgi:general secretion pathway protein M
MLRDFLAKYSQRDQAVIIVMGAVVVLWLCYLLVLEPLLSLKNQNQDDYVANQELLLWMKNSAAEVGALGGSANVRTSGSGSSAVVVVESALQQSGLTAPKRIEPDGNNKAVVQYDTVDFDKLMRALDRLQHSYGIVVSQASINKSQTPGQTSALLNLERAQ